MRALEVDVPVAEVMAEVELGAVAIAEQDVMAGRDLGQRGLLAPLPDRLPGLGDDRALRLGLELGAGLVGAERPPAGCGPQRLS